MKVRVKLCTDEDLLMSGSLQMESAVTAPVSGHIKRVVVNEGKSRSSSEVKVFLTYLCR